MSERTLQSEILEQLDGIPLEKQRRVLDFVRSLAIPAGKPGREVLLSGRGIEPEDLNAMSKAIEEGCEQVNINEW